MVRCHLKDYADCMIAFHFILVSITVLDVSKLSSESTDCSLQELSARFMLC